MRFFMATVLLLAGCATSLSDGGRMVREISVGDTVYCDYLGVVQGGNSMGWDVGHDRLGALNEIRNKLAKLGGNAYVLSSLDSSLIQSLAQAEAYLCPEATPYLPSLDEESKTSKPRPDDTTA